VLCFDVFENLKCQRRAAVSTVTLHGIKIPLSPDEVSPVIWQAIVSGRYEAKEAKWVFKAVKSGDRVLELGSGIGVITSLMATVADVQIWAFEANPSTADLARRVIDLNTTGNVSLSQGILTAGAPADHRFYVRKDLWMSSMDKDQGPYEREISLASANIDDFIAQKADLNGVERIFLELHDHLYGLAGIRDMTQALAAKGYAYDPRGSYGPCVLFSKDEAIREYEDDDAETAIT
jgi:hypothetical protein